MDGLPEGTLEARIVGVLRAAGGPLRAIDIVRLLAAEHVVAGKDAVNRALYHGPFAKVAGATGAPRWAEQAPQATLAREGHVVFQVDEVGSFCLRDTLTRDQFGVVLAAALSLVPEGAAATVRADSSAGGNMVGELAGELAAGRAAAALLGP